MKKKAGPPTNDQWACVNEYGEFIVDHRGERVEEVYDKDLGRGFRVVTGKIVVDEVLRGDRRTT